MKKFFFTAMFLFFFTVIATANTASAEDIVDARRAAQVFADIDVEYYIGSFGFSRKTTSGGGGGFSTVASIEESMTETKEKEYPQWINADFKIVGGLIVELTINGKVIVTEDDEPLPGLPPNEIGETRDFNLWLTGYEEDVTAVVTGSFYKQILFPGDPITVKLQPMSKPHFVQFQLPEGVSPEDLSLYIKNYGQWNYDSKSSGFQLYLNPAKVYDYQIIDTASGIIYAIGEIDQLEEINPTDKISIVNISLPDGVREVDFDGNNYPYFNNQQMGGFVEMDGEMVSAQVYFMNMDEKSGSVNFSGISNQLIEVRRWVEIGEMPIIAETTESYLRIDSGYGKIVVTVTGSVGENGFYSSFSKWDY